MAEEKAERIAALMRQHGAVLLQCSVPLVPHADLDRIGARLEFQSALAAAEGTHMGNSTNQRGNTGAAGFMTSSLPRRAEWVTPSIVANPIIEQAVAACLGRGCFLNTFGTITNHPGSETQDLHMVRAARPPQPTHATTTQQPSNSPPHLTCARHGARHTQMRSIPRPPPPSLFFKDPHSAA